MGSEQRLYDALLKRARLVEQEYNGTSAKSIARNVWRALDNEWAALREVDAGASGRLETAARKWRERPGAGNPDCEVAETAWTDETRELMRAVDALPGGSSG